MGTVRTMHAEQGIAPSPKCGEAACKSSKYSKEGEAA